MTDNKKFYTDIQSHSYENAELYIKNDFLFKEAVKVKNSEGRKRVIRGGDVTGFKIIQCKKVVSQPLDKTTKCFLFAVGLSFILLVSIFYMKEQLYLNKCNSYGDGTTIFSRLECEMIMED